MNQLETAIGILKDNLVQMWYLVISQMEKSRLALLNADKGLAHEVRTNERRVDAFELKIDMDSENILMLKNPVAIDMRFVISALKINYNLERIGDYANTFARIAEKIKQPWPDEMFAQTHIPEMYFIVQTMLGESLEAFDHSDKSLVKELLKLDLKLDKYNEEAGEVVAGLIQRNPEKINDYLEAFTVMRKLERAGDHVLNIGEELMFLFEAVVIKHSKLSKG